MSDITFEFACTDDCLQKMVPSDLRGLVAERDNLRQRVKEQDDFISQLADHTQAVEAELIKWQNGELRTKSKSPYLSGELGGQTFKGLGFIPEQDKPA